MDGRSAFSTCGSRSLWWWRLLGPTGVVHFGGERETHYRASEGDDSFTSHGQLFRNEAVQKNRELSCDRNQFGIKI
jgi:hypothetical protein